MTDPKAVVDLMLEGPPMNLSKVRTALRFAQELNAALAKAGAPI